MRCQGPTECGNACSQSCSSCGGEFPFWALFRSPVIDVPGISAHVCPRIMGLSRLLAFISDHRGAITHEQLTGRFLTACSQVLVLEGGARTANPQVVGQDRERPTTAGVMGGISSHLKPRRRFPQAFPRPASTAQEACPDLYPDVLAMKLATATGAFMAPTATCHSSGCAHAGRMREGYARTQPYGAPLMNGETGLGVEEYRNEAPPNSGPSPSGQRYQSV